MRAREFIKEQRELPPEIADPMRYTYVMPGLSASDPYLNYRFGVAMARARSDMGLDVADAERYMPAWEAETAFGEHGVISGFDANVDTVIDRALAMTNTPGGKKIVSSPESREPQSVSSVSPIRPFPGYAR